MNEDALALLERELALAEFTAVDRSALVSAAALAAHWPQMTDEERRRAFAVWYLFFVEAPERVIYPRERKRFEDMPAHRFRSYFRFESGDIGRLIAALRLPATVVTDDGHRLCATDALLLLLRRLASGTTLAHMEDEFALGKSTMSAISWQVMDELFAHFNETLFCAPCCWNHARLRAYVRAVKAKVEELTGEQWPNDVIFVICGFLDGTFLYTCRPGDDFPGQDLQRSLYSGYYKGHGYRGHNLVFPDGMVGHTTRRLIAGRQNDNTLFDRSGYLGLIVVALQLTVLVWENYCGAVSPHLACASAQTVATDATRSCSSAATRWSGRTC
jgi:hypothetical protein